MGGVQLYLEIFCSMFSVPILLLDSSNLTARVGTLRRENERKNREIEILNRTVRQTDITTRHTLLNTHSHVLHNNDT